MGKLILFPIDEPDPYELECELPCPYCQEYGDDCRCDEPVEG